jgi:hypothetical protein
MQVFKISDRLETLDGQPIDRILGCHCPRLAYAPWNDVRSGVGDDWDARAGGCLDYLRR